MEWTLSVGSGTIGNDFAIASAYMAGMAIKPTTTTTTTTSGFRGRLVLA